MANARKPVVHRLTSRRESPSGERDRTRSEEAVRTLLSHVGEDPAREGLVRTPLRMVQALEFLTSGYMQDPKDAINDYVVHGEATVNPDGVGTKAALHYTLTVPGGGSAVLCVLRTMKRAMEAEIGECPATSSRTVAAISVGKASFRI